MGRIYAAPTLVLVKLKDLRILLLQVQDLHFESLGMYSDLQLTFLEKVLGGEWQLHLQVG